MGLCIPVIVGATRLILRSWVPLIHAILTLESSGGFRQRRSISIAVALEQPISLADSSSWMRRRLLRRRIRTKEMSERLARIIA